MQQRYYDPLIGQGLSVDPVTAYDKGDMRFFNRYAYAFNNPYKFNDPDGRESACFSNNSGCGLRPETEQDRRDVVVSMLGFGALMAGGLLAPEAVGAGSAMGAFKALLGMGERRAERVVLTRAQQQATKKVENIIANNAKPHDFAGVQKELSGVETGFDHVTEMRNSVTGLKDALKSLQGSLNNKNLSSGQRAAIETTIKRANETIEEMKGALNGQ